MSSRLILLGAVAALADQMAVACSRCDRAGRFSTARLLAARRSDMPMTARRRIPAGYYPWLHDDRLTEICGAYYPDLARLTDVTR
jgi:hypothetical protein